MRRLFFFIMLGIVALTVLWIQAERRPHRPEAQYVSTEMARIHESLDHMAGQPVDLRSQSRIRFADGTGARESIDDLPVPIVPGSRVTQAEIQPPRPPAPPQRRGPNRADPKPARVSAIKNAKGMALRGEPVVGRLSATDDRARADAELQLQRRITEWLMPEVPSSWPVPNPLLHAVALSTEVQPVEKELGTLYEATIRADLSPARRVEIVETYHRELVARRLMVLAGVLAFILSCLAGLAGYIKADEATKGYYTNRLRIVSAAGVGAAGVLIYQILT